MADFLGHDDSRQVYGDGNHRIYYVATKDFKTFSPTKLLYDGGFNVIDATILKEGGKYYLIVKDETKTPMQKRLRIAVADRAEGRVSLDEAQSAGDSAQIFHWTEMPRGDLLFLSLASHRHLRINPTGDMIAADAPGAQPDRQNGASFIWREIAATTVK